MKILHYFFKHIIFPIFLSFPPLKRFHSSFCSLSMHSSIHVFRMRGDDDTDWSPPNWEEMVIFLSASLHSLTRRPRAESDVDGRLIVSDNLLFLPFTPSLPLLLSLRLLHRGNDVWWRSYHLNVCVYVKKGRETDQ